MLKVTLGKRKLYNGNLILVNEDNPIKREFIRGNLEAPFLDNKDILINKKVSDILREVLTTIDGYEEIVPVSGYRTLDEQINIYNTSLIVNGEEFTKKYVAEPDCSEHQTGLAIDLGKKLDNVDFICPEFPYEGICQRFREVAVKYGFIERYKEDKKFITKISGEPWHFRYVGYPHSEIITENNLSLEEYLEFIKKYKYGENPYVFRDTKRKFLIAYKKYIDENTTIELEDHDLYEISGNNYDGFIVTLCSDDVNTKYDLEIRDRAWTEISLDNLKHNVKEIKKCLKPGCEFMAVVKANAYGHGDIEISRYLNKINVNNFGVATIDEAIELREAGIKGDILILGYTHPSRILDLVKYDLIQTVVDHAYAEELNIFERDIRVHLKIDTGMHRLGEDYNNKDIINKIFGYKNLKIEGVFSHLYVADSEEEEDVICTKEQIKNFFKVGDTIKKKFNPKIKFHIQSSYGVLNYPNLDCDYARIGIAMYGVKSSIHDNIKSHIELKPVLSIKARIAIVKNVKKGDAVSYGRQYIAKSNMKVATVTIGYADGIPRNISNGNACVLVNGMPAPVIGRICMDQLMIDVTNISDVEEGDIVTLIGRDKEKYVSAEDMSEAAGTITNEFLSRLSRRLKYCYR